MAEQDTPRTLKRRDLARKAKEMGAGLPATSESEVRRLRGLIRAILSKGPYVFDPRDEIVVEGKAVTLGRCFWCGAGVVGTHAEAKHSSTCAWLALEAEAAAAS